jgi:hypothetical protein
VDNFRYMHLSGKIGGYLATAQRYDRRADVEDDPVKAEEWRSRAVEYRQRAEDARTERGPRRGHKRFGQT